MGNAALAAVCVSFMWWILTMHSVTEPVPKHGPIAQKIKAMQYTNPLIVDSMRLYHGYSRNNHPITNLDLINKSVNKYIRYTTENEDTWQLPFRTFQLKRGDCEDFALLKRALLQGGPYETKLAVVRRKADNQAHAVLFVEVQWEGNTHEYVLDNLSNTLLRVEDWLQHFDLIYTTNGQTITLYNGATL